jgi:energy-coupling factor transporter ATP-binding protein EcfA2
MMRIVQLTAENYGRLSAVDIRPTGDLVEITGRNAQGKTSVLNAIWSALKHAENVQSVPIHLGADSARIRLDLGELIVERKFTPSGTTLIVENAEGARFRSPQSVLDALVGALSFDPLAFTRKKPREQFDDLRRVAKVEVDFDALDGLNKRDFERRTEVNRQAKAARAKAEALPPVTVESADKFVETQAEILDRMEKASQHNAAIDAEIMRRQGERERAESLAADAGKYDAEVIELRAKAGALSKRADAIRQQSRDIFDELGKAPALPASENVADLRARLDRVREFEKALAAVNQRKQHEETAGDLERQANAITDAMAAREKRKADAIAAAKFPVAGLGLGDGVVTLNGIPLAQASSAEQLRVSLAVAMAANPKLRVIRIQDGSLLDPDSLAVIESMAAAADFQIWIERVDATGKVGIVIDDGKVAAVNDEPAAQAAE